MTTTRAKIAAAVLNDQPLPNPTRPSTAAELAAAIAFVADGAADLLHTLTGDYSP